MSQSSFDRFSVFAPIQACVYGEGAAFVEALPSVTRQLLMIPLAAGDAPLSLTDAQTPEEQLRFFQKDRVFRVLRELALRFAEVRTERTVALVGDERCLASEPVLYFIECLRDFDVAVETRIAAREEQVEGCLEQALERLSRGDTWSAQRLIEMRPDSFPEDERERILAISLALQGRTDEAETHFEQWRRLSSPVNQAWAMYSLAMLYARHHSARRRSLARAGELLEEAFAILNGVQEDGIHLRFSRIFNRNGYALILFRRGEVDEAISILKPAIEMLSDEHRHLRLHKSVLIYNLAQCYVSQERLGEAREQYLRLIQMDPDYAENRIEFAKVLIDLDEKDSAASELRTAIRLDPTVPAAFSLLGSLLRESGDPIGAIRCHRRAIALEPAVIAHSLELCESLIVVGDLEQAAKTLEVVDEEEAFTDDREAWESLIVLKAEIALRAGGRGFARGVLSAAIAKRPDAAILRENLEEVMAYE